MYSKIGADNKALATAALGRFLRYLFQQYFEAFHGVVPSRR